MHEYALGMHEHKLRMHEHFMKTSLTVQYNACFDLEGMSLGFEARHMSTCLNICLSTRSYMQHLEMVCTAAQKDVSNCIKWN